MYQRYIINIAFLFLFCVGPTVRKYTNFSSVTQTIINIFTFVKWDLI